MFLIVLWFCSSTIDSFALFLQTHVQFSYNLVGFVIVTRNRKKTR